MSEMTFDAWIDELEESVIQGEFGIEPGEFTVYRNHWKPSWRKGLSPKQPFQKALDDYGQHRRKEEAERLENWRRIQAADARAIAEYRSRSATS